MQPSASKTDLLLQCSYPFDPKRTLMSEPPGEAAIYGTQFHKAMEQLLAAETLVYFSEEVTRHVEQAHERLHAYLASSDYLAGRRLLEYAMAFTPRTFTARDIPGPNEDHVYMDLRPDEIAGTADLIVIPTDPTKPVLVLDHKTGLSGDFTKPHLLPQLLTLGFSVLARFNRSSFVPAVLHAPRGGLPQVFEGDVQRIDVDGSKFVQLLRLALDRVGDGSLRPNKLCYRCPARHDCPARVVDLIDRSGELVEKANLVGSELVLVNNDNALSREARIGKLHLLLARFRELDRRASEEIKRELRANPGTEVVRPDGRTLMIVTKSVERISKASIVRALGKEAGAAKIEELRAAGCLTETDQDELHAK